MDSLCLNFQTDNNNSVDSKSQEVEGKTATTDDGGGGSDEDRQEPSGTETAETKGEESAKATKSESAMEVTELEVADGGGGEKEDGGGGEMKEAADATENAEKPESAAAAADKSGKPNRQTFLHR